MTSKLIPSAKRPTPKGVFERTMALGAKIPGRLGYIARRKLKRRLCWRQQDTFAQVLAETGPGDLCLDLGANVGTFSCRMAKTGADVISFEPDPGAFAALQEATRDLPNVTTIPKAVGHQNDTLMLCRTAKWSHDDPSGHTQGSSIVHRAKGMIPQNAIEVEVVDLIAFLEELGRDVRIVKMDIEGAEWEVLNRLIDHPVLARIECMFVETHERQDPAKYVPMFDRIQARAEQITRPYINLFWI